MTRGDINEQLHRLVTGLADQEIKAGLTFCYDGGELHAEEVSHIALPSILCIAQDMSARLGMGDFGLRFELTETPEPVFPLHAVNGGTPSATFMTLAPLVTEVFDREVRECRHDLARLFEMAAQRVDNSYLLSTRTTYTAAEPGVRSAHGDAVRDDLEN